MYPPNHHDPHRSLQQPPPPPPPPPPPAHPPHMSRVPSSSSSSASAPQHPPSANGAPEPKGFSARNEGRIYSLEVVQQPVRARMCGFGDKDRRPITPPPCVRLVVRDAKTLKEVDINEVETSYYVLTVDLWSADGSREVNLVRHSATSPSISATTSSSYPPPPPTPPPHANVHPPMYGGPMHSHNPQPISYPGYHPPPGNPPPQQQNDGGYYQPQGGYYNPQMGGGAPPPPQQQQQGGAPPQNPAPTGMFTRNLIGSLSASAFKLTDTDNKIGVWFILQDLSVRTEGQFRLKMNFINVGKPDGQGLNTGIAPVLATAFSDVFHVYSAKKFPGVPESTKLSKCFAHQGIKIPIRREKDQPADGGDM